MAHADTVAPARTLEDEPITALGTGGQGGNQTHQDHREQHPPEHPTNAGTIRQQAGHPSTAGVTGLRPDVARSGPASGLADRQTRRIGEDPVGVLQLPHVADDLVHLLG